MDSGGALTLHHTNTRTDTQRRGNGNFFNDFFLPLAVPVGSERPQKERIGDPRPYL